MISYYDRFQFSVPQLQFFHTHFTAESKKFHTTYVQKVLNEYIIALKGRVVDQAETLTREGKSTKKRSVKQSNEDALDAALDAMLEGHLQGFGDDFEDDFDILATEVLQSPKKRKKTK